MKNFNEMNKFLKLCLDIANAIDNDEDYYKKYLAFLGLGQRAASNLFRTGIKLCIDMQTDYYRKIAEIESAQDGEKEAREFIKNCFGDDEIFTINDKDKKRIIELCNQIAKEWEKKE